MRCEVQKLRYYRNNLLMCMIDETIEDNEIQKETGENPSGNISIDSRVIEYTEMEKNKLLSKRYVEISLNSCATVYMRYII